MLAAALFALAVVAQQPAKRPLTHHDYDGWRVIQNQTLSHDGKFLAYALFPQEGDGELLVRDLTTGKERREAIGALPPAPDNTNFETPAAETTVARGIQLAFSADNHYLISTHFPSKADTDKAKKDKKRPDEMPKGGLLLLDLTAGTTTRIADVASMQVPEKNPGWVAYLKTAKPGSANRPTTPRRKRMRINSVEAAGAGPRPRRAAPPEDSTAPTWSCAT